MRGILARMPVHVDQFIRSKRRTIAIIVQNDGCVIVRAPLRAPERTIRAFLERKSAWIVKKQAEMAQRMPLSEKRFQAGERFPLLGREIPLRVVERQKTALTFDGAFVLAKDCLPRAAQAFEGWYRAEARRVLSERVAWYAAEFGFRYQKIRITSARTRWGSCSVKGTLSFPWRLVMAPPEVIDYVVVHELVHLKVPNHSRTFWAEVAARLPDYKVRMKWLKENGHSLRLV